MVKWCITNGKLILIETSTYSSRPLSFDSIFRRPVCHKPYDQCIDSPW